MINGEDGRVVGTASRVCDVASTVCRKPVGRSGLSRSELTEAQGELQPKAGPTVVEVDPGQAGDLVEPVVQGGAVPRRSAGSTRPDPGRWSASAADDHWDLP